MEEYGLDVLRIDYNIDPAPVWAAAEVRRRTVVSLPYKLPADEFLSRSIFLSRPI